MIWKNIYQICKKKLYKLQSSRYNAIVEKQNYLTKDKTLQLARKATTAKGKGKEHAENSL